MSIDPRLFRQTVGQFVTGVTVIAMEVDGSIRALTANSFTSLSLNPPLVLFCLGKGTKAGQLIHAGRRVLGQHPEPGAAAALVLLRRRVEGRDAAAVLVHALGGRSAARRVGRGPRLSRRAQCTKAAITGSSSARSSPFTAASCLRAPLVFFGGRYSSLAGEQTSSRRVPDC